MVFFFSTSDGLTVYMGRDKFENEELIKHMWPEDVWFHVDDLSSAHVYLRLPLGKGIDDIPETALAECCQLVKANSIEGSKRSSVRIVYTPWQNLKKVDRHDVGTVTFHKMSKCKYVKNVSKDREMLRRINKTKEEPTIDLAKAKARRDEEERLRLKAEHKAAAKERARTEKEEREAAKREADDRAYKSLFKDHDRGAAAAAASSRGKRGGAAAAAAADDDFFGDEDAPAAAAAGDDSEDEEAAAAALAGLM
ncbi:hypothetical protein FNF29_05072 [Cafeteria roenbergensis]|uniref:NFACT RNA-binding domain-containing protein n=1 Tax=Cafeteria roenbergensis TaxID=33653 RepID=A0A5A8CCS5_CAFRO|nr:hypothetical protein FNF29_05072 [Cafeteria roenbergensis]|eukprot:KAA0150735.1 hypothetical protein FNF29_05072 [Cafeteria roenbergensis]